MYYICCMNLENQKARMRKGEWQIENEYSPYQISGSELDGLN